MKKITKWLSFALFAIFFAIAIFNQFYGISDSMSFAFSVSSWFLSWSTVIALQAQVNQQVAGTLEKHQLAKNAIEKYTKQKLITHEKANRVLYYLLIAIALVAFLTISIFANGINKKLSDLFTTLSIAIYFFAIWYESHAKQRCDALEEQFDDIEQRITQIIENNEKSKNHDQL